MRKRVEWRFFFVFLFFKFEKKNVFALSFKMQFGNVIKVRWADMMLNEPVIESLCAALSLSASGIVDVNLFNSELDARCASLLGAALAQNKSVQTLNVRDNKLGNSGLLQLFDAIAVNTTVRCIDVAGNAVSSSPSSSSSKVKSKRTKKRRSSASSGNGKKSSSSSRRFSSSSSGGESSDSIGKNDESNNENNNNTNGDGGDENDKLFEAAGAFGEIVRRLAANNGLEELDMSSMGLRTSSLAALCAAVRAHATLKRLSLSFNTCGVSGASSLVPLLGRLESLRLDHAELGDEGCALIAKAIESGGADAHIRLLSLANNDIEDIGAAALATMLVANTSMRTLLLADNRLRQAGGASLCAALESTNRTLTHIELTWNLVPTELELRIEQLVANNRRQQ
jgi:Leucine Rich repeat